MLRNKNKHSPVDHFDEIFVSGQPELRKIASYLKRSDESITLNVTALVNETYVKLRQGASDVESELHLRQRAGRAMRQILADAARRRAAEKRGGDGSIQFVCWDDNMEQFVRNDWELLALDAALTELASLDPRQSDMVEWHFFGGLTWNEVAGCLGISLATVEREWRMLRAWLAEQIQQNR